MTRRPAIGAWLSLAALTAGLLAGCSVLSRAAAIVAPDESVPSASASADAKRAAWDRALADASALPLHDAAGQVIMAAVTSPAAGGAAKAVAGQHLAGVIVMGDAVEDAAQVTRLTGAVASADPDRGWPVLIATDEEGGTVQRLKPALGYVSALMGAGANGDSAQIRDYYAALGEQMRGLGFTMDLAPVADVTIGLKDPTIRTRSAGSSPDAVARVANAAWEGLLAGGLTPVIKHFPGHGSVKADSHRTLPLQPKTVAELESRDLIPFRSAIEAGAPVVMVGHLQVAGWGKLPTSVNPRSYAYLREQMGFDGLIVTDAMNMEAITDRFAAGAETVAALAAGADLVLMPPDTKAAIKAVVDAVEAGKLSRSRLDDAAAHVIVAARSQAAVATEGEVRRPAEFVEGSIVVASAHCSALVGDAVHLVGGTAAQRKLLAKAFAAAGIAVGAKGTEIALVGGDRGHANADVVVATGGPWGLASSHAQTYVATWGGGAEQMRALARVLTGEVAPRGTWPVGLKLPYEPCS